VRDALRQPLEDGVVRVCRARSSLTFPARFLLVGAMNPCPCGEGGAPGSCRCTEAARSRYGRRLSGPLLDRFDLRVPIARPEVSELLGGAAGEPTAAVASRVAEARGRAAERGVRANAELSPRRLDEVAPLSSAAARLLEWRLRTGALSGRGLHRVRRVARTVADLDGGPAVQARGGNRRSPIGDHSGRDPGPVQDRAGHHREESPGTGFHLGGPQRGGHRCRLGHRHDPPCRGRHDGHADPGRAARDPQEAHARHPTQQDHCGRHRDDEEPTVAVRSTVPRPSHGPEQADSVAAPSRLRPTPAPHGGIVAHIAADLAAPNASVRPGAIPSLGSVLVPSGTIGGSEDPPVALGLGRLDQNVEAQLWP